MFKGKRLLAFWGFVWLAGPVLAFAQVQFDGAEYTLPLPSGRGKGDVYEGTLRFDKDRKEVQFLSKGGSVPLRVKYNAIKSMLYERTARPRYALTVLAFLSKSKKHYLTIDYTDVLGARQFAVIRLDKDNYREVLATAEAETGKKVDRTEER